MLNIGTLTFIVTPEKKTVKLRIDSKSLGLQTETSPADLLRVAAYLAGEAEKAKEGTENGR